MRSFKHARRTGARRPAHPVRHRGDARRLPSSNNSPCSGSVTGTGESLNILEERPHGAEADVDGFSSGGTAAEEGTQ